MALENFRMLNNEFLNKDPYVVPEQAPLIILDTNQLSAWILMINTSNTPDRFPDKYT